MTRLTSPCIVALLLITAACGGDDTTGTGTETTVTATDPTTDGSSGSPTTDPTAEDPTATTTAESSSTGADGSTGSSSTGADESSSGDSSTGAACQLVTEDVSAVGQACDNDVDCPDAYTCIDAGGIVQGGNCRIVCEEDCQCVEGYSCQEIQGKVMNLGSECLPG